MVIFVALTVIIFGLFSHFYKPPAEPPQTQNQTAGQAAPGQTNTGAQPAQTAASSPGAPKAPVSIPAIQASDERSIVVESPLYRVELSNRGAVVRSWKLKKYFDDQTPPHPLDLVDSSASQQLGWPFSLTLPDSQLESQANSALYQVTPSAGGSDSTLSAPVDVTFHWSDGHLDITKKLSFAADYQLSVETSVSLDGKQIAPVGIAWRGGFGDRAVYKAAQLVSVFYQTNGKLTLLQYKKLGVSSNQSQPAEQPGPMEFLGIEDQFFTAAFIPNGSDLALWHWMQNHTLTDGTEPEAEMAAGTKIAAPLRVRVYVGPKDLALLSKVQPSLEVLINFGWTGIIAKPLLFALQWLHKYIPNYGWAIVLFTLALTTVLFPIRITTSRSMRKMQAVAPEIRSIQDRYKKYSMSDPRKRKMNEEVMAVYSREGINPMGSCLPMLIQLPFLWAFYRMLSGAIELRHAPWIFWIHDLSAKDPYYILPIAMTLTSFLMMKMTPQPTAGDPTQQKMMAFMPLMMGAIFINLSSGLNLYYFVNNLVGMAQQWYLNRTMPPPNNSKFKKNKE
jgi:YidC/Oxa1 family membrane protein insertase